MFSYVPPIDLPKFTSLTFSPNIVGPQLLHYAFFCPPLEERALLATGKGQIIEQWSISLKLILCVGVKKISAGLVKTPVF